MVQVISGDAIRSVEARPGSRSGWTPDGGSGHGGACIDAL